MRRILELLVGLSVCLDVMLLPYIPSYQKQKKGSKRKIGLLLTLKKNELTLRCYICFW
jgi:hypothetical protein